MFTLKILKIASKISRSSLAVVLRQNNDTKRLICLTHALQTSSIGDGSKTNGSEKIMTMAKVKEVMRKSLGLAATYNPNPPPRDELLKYEPKFEDLPPRSMQDSYTSAVIPLSTDLELRDKYTAFMGRLRVGRLLEDMDIFAAWICHQHLHIPNLDPNIPLPYTFVTILVDKIDYTMPNPLVDQDIRISGHISWVGRSSMEIVVWLEQNHQGKWQKITRALFLFAARNATNTKSAPVNPLVAGSDHEAKILAGGEERRLRRIQIQEQSLFRAEPNDDEQRLIHEIFMKTIEPDAFFMNHPILPPNSVWLSDTVFSTVILSHPEDRNAHNRVFGGYLMRQGLEAAFGCAYMFARERPTLEHVCDIAFRKPVAVSSFIKMKAHVIYTEGNRMQVVTVANIRDAQTGEQFTTNLFHFTFSTEQKCAKVVPKTYHEAIWFLEGKRKMAYATRVE